MKVYIGFVLYFLLFASGVHAEGLEGNWYGEGYQPQTGKYHQWFKQQKADGTYIVDFRRYEECKLVERQVETGIWRRTPMGWCDKVTAINGRMVQSTQDDYVIKDMDGTKMRYQHSGTGETWTSRRVGPDFKFPACEPMS